MKIPKKVILIYFCLLLHSTFGQNFSPIFKNISKELPSSEVHDIIQDSLGYIWLATDRGVTRFDGQNFKKLNTEKYFTSSTFQFFKESNEKFWFNTGDNELYWFNPFNHLQELNPYIFNDTLTKVINTSKKAKFIRMLYMQGNSCRITFLKGSGYLEINENGIGTLKKVIITEHQTHHSSNLFINHNNDFSYTEFEYNGTSNGNISTVTNNFQDTLLISPKFSYNNFWLYGISDIIEHNDRKYILCGKYLIRFDKKNISFIELSSEGIKLYKDNDHFFVCTFNGVFEIDKTLKIVGSFLIDYSVTSVVKDHEDGFWFSTLNSGVFYTKNVNLKYLANSSNITPTLLLIKNNNLLVMNNNKELHIFSKEGEFIETFNSVYHTNNLFSSPNPNLGRYLEPYVNFNLKAKIFAYYPSKPERNYHGENKIICKIGRDSLTKIKEFTNTPAIKDCFALNDSIILIATKKGLYSYNADTDSLLLRQKTYTLRK